MVEAFMGKLVGTAFSNELVEHFRRFHDASIRSGWFDGGGAARDRGGPWELTSLRDQIHGSADQFRFSLFSFLLQHFFWRFFVSRFLCRKMEGGRNESFTSHFFLFGVVSSVRGYTNNSWISLDVHKCQICSFVRRKRKRTISSWQFCERDLSGMANL